jgi:6-phosphogluconolactonase (cycloisomerase 2 family)
MIHRLFRKGILLLFAALFTAVSCPVTLAQTSTVYVESNRADQNSILAYRNTGGRLTFLGEFPTGGKGVFDLSLQLGPFDSDQNIETNAEGTVLYAVNSGSDSIAIFSVAPNGSLSPLPGSPFASGGINPVSVGIARDTLAVVNKAMDPARPALKQPNYVSFALAPEGTIEAGPLSTVLAPIESSPSQADVSSGKRLVFDAQFLGGHLQSFFIAHDGSLIPQDFQALPESEFAGSSAPRLPLGLWTHPHQPILYVGFVTINRLGVYTYDSTGHLQFIRSVPNSGQAICWIRSNADGTRLYTANTNDSSISVYDTTFPLRPVEIQHLRLKGLGNPFQITLDPRGSYLYVVTQRATPSIPLGEGNTLQVLKINQPTGKLSQQGSSVVKLPVPPGTRPQGVVAVQNR